MVGLVSSLLLSLQRPFVMLLVAGVGSTLLSKLTLAAAPLLLTVVAAVTRVLMVVIGFFWVVLRPIMYIIAFCVLGVVYYALIFNALESNPHVITVLTDGANSVISRLYSTDYAETWTRLYGLAAAYLF